MSARILDGAKLAERLLSEIASRISQVTRKRGFPATLAIVSIGENAGARLHIQRLRASCSKVSVASRRVDLPADISESEALRTLQSLGQDNSIDGIILETPLPTQIRHDQLLGRLPPEKDVECLTPSNYGRLFTSKNLEDIRSLGAFIPTTPHAILELLLESGACSPGMEAVVLGRSSVVGRPAAHILSCLDCTVTLCHSKTRNLTAHLRRADILITAVGKPGFIQGADIKPGAVVLDAGIAYKGSRVCGDADSKSIGEAAGWVTPVPGGVGPVTTALLIKNVVAAAERGLDLAQ